MGTSSDVALRDREPADLPRLVGVLEAQQAGSGYPVRWPLPFPAEEFVVRPGELGAWVAQVGGVVAGHVALLHPASGWEAAAFREAMGLPPERMATVSTLFVDAERRGAGIGTRLIDVAVAHARALGRVPVLDVVQEHSPAAALYRRRGWRVVGEARPHWLPADREPVLLMTLDDPAEA
ncbi:GNAT family N-acetyltransferase [Phycicoccus duodecadis]|uniref:Ribosomal protein S18 acetylase RimI-like enzyme n=1 Tax=Phycicoccus duodecadis TaxID=173053 RepID=A0A2N3YF10_9MICO|nr:GNAT family N-acetyltransferase [Phycicoccus duodecadis]PKW25439.1 ribosomal protein S18 acetylase RimI-like enzyme [Phycicoccus duodecadis]